MRVLVADDDRLVRDVLTYALREWGHEVVAVDNGDAALLALLSEDAPTMAVLDWMMPGLSGPEVCRRVRAEPLRRPCYLILLTSRDKTDDIVAGLAAGADDYLTKSFKPAELRARIDVGIRVVQLQTALAARVQELEEALSQVRTLRGLIPICAQCKKIRDDEGFYHSVEKYLSRHTDARFSHGLCPDCAADFEASIAAWEATARKDDPAH